MDFKDPVKIYSTNNNLEATMLADFLVENGVNAFAEMDDSGILALVGAAFESEHCGVWIDKSQTEEAQQLIRQFEEKKHRHLKTDEVGTVITVQCDACGKSISFPASSRGTIEECPECGEYLDVED